jgi:hypothetical protein
MNARPSDRTPRRYTLLTGERRARVAAAARALYEAGFSLDRVADRLAHHEDVSVRCQPSANTVRRLIAEADGTIRPSGVRLTRRAGQSGRPSGPTP